MPNAIISKSNVRNMFRTSWLSTLMSSAVCALVATSAIGEAVFAQIRIPGQENLPLLPGQRRVTYKISDINPSDAERFCKQTYGSDTSFRIEPESDRVLCLRRASTTQTQFGVQGGMQGPVPTGGFTLNQTINDPDWKAEPHHLNEVCRNKHGDIGTWVGDGGRSCYDSYRTF